jgi:hypothetical protein
MPGEEAGNVYRLVFELTARATDVPYEQFLEELVAGLASHYEARVCRLHVGDGPGAVASADPDQVLEELDSDSRARFDTIDEMLAEEVRRDGVLRMALDLEGGEEIVNFLGRSLRTPETFAFPLIARGRAFGAIALYLEDAYPFEEADVRGLQAIGNVLYAATNRGEQFSVDPPELPLTDQKLRAYQDTMESVGKILDELLFLTDAKCVLLIDSRGDFIAKRGEDSVYSSTNFSTVVASGFAAARRLSGFFGAQETRSVLHEGETESAFVIEVTGQALLCIVFRDHEAPGLITRWTQSAAHRLAEHYEALLEARAV